MNIMLTIGDVINDKTNNKKYRVVAIVDNEITLCEMNISIFSLTLININSLMSLILDGEITLSKEEKIVFDKNKLSEEVQKKFEKKHQMMLEVLNAYAPNYMDLCGRKSKEPIKKIIDKYNIPRNSFWRTCIQFFQSGFQEYSLVDARTFGVNAGKTYNHEIKAGRPNEYFDNAGVVLTNEIRNIFAETLADYKNGRHKTLKSAFDKMNLLHFTKTEIVDGKPSVVLMPISERPTWAQFRYYYESHF